MGEWLWSVNLMPTLPLVASGVVLPLDLQGLWTYHFMDNAFQAGVWVALVAGSVGYLMTLRGQSFAGHTLASVGFAGAAGANLLGWPLGLGLILATVGTALAMAGLGNSKDDQVAIGAVQAFAIGLGLLFLQLAPNYGPGAYSLLFGAVLGISDQDLQLLLGTTLATLGGLGTVGRPLLFASLAEDLAVARGVPVGLLSQIFLVLLAVAVAQAVQVVGVLLIFVLLAAPGAIAVQLTSRPAWGLLLSVVLAWAFSWVGLSAAYFWPYPAGFFITTCAFATYAVVRLLRWRRRPTKPDP